MAVVTTRQNPTSESGEGLPTVFIVDDDPDVRRTVAMLVRSVGITATQFVSAKEFLDSYHSDEPGCLILDMRMPEMSGLELQKEMQARGIELPIIFISAHGEISNATTAMRAGAVDFIDKPYNPQLLLERVQEALAIDRKNRLSQRQRLEINARIATLTEREHELMSHLAAGDSTKVIASKFGISSKTVDNHRGKILDKMGVDNPTQLTRLLSQLNDA